MTHVINPGNGKPGVQAFQFIELVNVPEPSTLALLVLGGIGLAGYALRRKIIPGAEALRPWTHVGR